MQGSCHSTRRFHLAPPRADSFLANFRVALSGDFTTLNIIQGFFRRLGSGNCVNALIQIISLVDFLVNDPNFLKETFGACADFFRFYYRKYFLTYLLRRQHFITRGTNNSSPFFVLLSQFKIFFFD